MVPCKSRKGSFVFKEVIGKRKVLIIIDLGLLLLGW